MKIQKLALGLIVALLGSLLPQQAFAFDPGLVTKTISVRDYQGRLYGPGAKVALVYRDSQDVIQITDLATTNNSGVASLQVDGSVAYIGLAVSPSSSDSVNGLQFLSGNTGFSQPEADFYAWDQSFEITLPFGDVQLLPQVESGDSTSNAPAGTILEMWTNDFGKLVVTLGTGPVRISLAGTGESESWRDVQIKAPGRGLFESVRSFEFAEGAYRDSNDSAAQGPFEVTLKAPNFQGLLVDGQGDALALPDGVNAQVRFLMGDRENPGQLSPWELGARSGTSDINQDGSFAGFIKEFPAEGDSPIAYYPQVFIAGSETLPSFIGEPFWVDSAGNLFSDSALTSPMDYAEIAVPDSSQITLLLNSVRRGTAIADPGLFSLQIQGDENTFGQWWGRLPSSNGIASYVIEDGNYNLQFYPASANRPSNEYQIELASSGTTNVWEYSTDSGFTATGTPTAIEVSGRSNDDIQVVISDPNTGEAINSSELNVYITYQNGQNECCGMGFGPTALGVFPIDFPNVGDFEVGSLQLVIEPSDRAETLDPLLAQKRYDIEIDNDGNVLVYDGQTLVSPIAQAASPEDSDSYMLTMAYANVFGWVKDFAGNPIGSDYEQNIWLNGDLQKLNPDTQNWEYVQGAYFQVRKDGFFGLQVDTAGTYRLVIQAWGDAPVAKTTSDQFTVVDSATQNYFDRITMSPPLAAVAVVAPSSTSPLTGGQVQIVSQSAGVHEWFQAGGSGYANIALDPGNYELTVNPPFGVALAKKTYTLTIGQDSAVSIRDGGVLVNPSDATGAYPQYQLELALPNLAGKVVDPTGTPVRYTQVVPVDPTTGWELWDLSANTDSSGRWALSLPEGTYDLFARAPWGDNTYVGSQLIQGLQIDANGDLVSGSLPEGLSSQNLTLTLSNPVWSGYVLTPDGTELVYNAEVCLQGPQRGVCSQVDSSGKWALGAPVGFTGFSDGWELVVREYFDAQFSEQRYRTSSEIEAVLGAYVQGSSYQNKQLLLGTPNVQITVLAGGRPVKNAWVNLDRPGTWLAGSSTDANGVARFDLDVPTQSFNARADIGHIASLASSYTSTRIDVAFAEGDDSNGVYSATINLDEPNFFGRVLSPDGSETQAYSWVELFDSETGMWVSNVSADANGQVSMRVPTSSGTITYSLKVNPGWQSSQFAKQTYALAIDQDGTKRLSTSSMQIYPQNGAYDLKLASPNVTGTVLREDGQTAVRDSWVVPILADTKWYLWDLGSNSRQDGSFAMNLEDGSYLLEASVPWYLTGLAKSSKCGVTIVAGNASYDGSSACVDGDGNFALRLREPNLKFRLVSGDSSTPVPFANAGIRIGDFNVNAQADRDGYVSMFIDASELEAGAEFALSQRWVNDQTQSDGIQVPLTVWVDPPWGDDSIVRWECQTGENQPICDDVRLQSLENTSTDGDPANGTWSTWTAPGDLGDIRFKEPNTEITVQYPNGELVGEGAWVSLFLEQTEVWGTWKKWFGGSNTGTSGKAKFNIPDELLAATFSVQVEAPWYERSTYPSRSYSGVKLDQTQATFRFKVGSEILGAQLPSKNLTIEVLQPQSAGVSKWSWVSIESYDPGTSQYQWLGGSGTNDKGKTALYLEPSADLLYKLTAHPGPGSIGSRFSCWVAVDPDTALVTDAPNGYVGCGTPSDASLSISLSLGNTRGKIVDSSSAPVAGAIVLASSSTEVVTYTSNSRGEFFMDLDTSQTWILKVLYVNPSDADPFVQRRKPDLASGNSDANPNDDYLQISFVNVDGQQVARFTLNGGSQTTDIEMFRVSE